MVVCLYIVRVSSILNYLSLSFAMREINLNFSNTRASAAAMLGVSHYDVCTFIERGALIHNRHHQEQINLSKTILCHHLSIWMYGSNWRKLGCWKTTGQTHKR